MNRPQSSRSFGVVCLSLMGLVAAVTPVPAGAAASALPKTTIGSASVQCYTAVIRGTASAQAGVREVRYQVDAGMNQLAGGTTQWAVTNDLTPGTHLVLAWCVDSNGLSSAQARVILDAPKVFPTVAIKGPPRNATLTAFPTNLTGSADACAGVAAVYFQINNGPVRTATGTNRWTAFLEADDLLPGTNTVCVWCVDTRGGESGQRCQKYFRQVLAPLMVLTNGPGKVTPDYNGQLLALGRGYTLTAMPAAGHLLSNWIRFSPSGTFTNTGAKLTFRMETNLVVNANFVTNPFIAAKGTYSGLFFEANGVRHDSSGFFDLTLTDRGSYSAKFRIGAAVYPFSGQFNLAGQTTQTVSLAGVLRFVTNQLGGGWFIGTRPVLRVYPVSLTAELALNLGQGSDQITGQVADGYWAAQLQANRPPVYSSANPCPYRGQYTLIIPGSAFPSASPGGAGFGTVTVGSDGKLSLQGSLADNTPANQSVPLSKDGEWPLYVPLYSGAGSILSWVMLSTNTPPANLVSGNLSWIKPSLPTAKYYPGGFTNLVPLEGSAYQPPGASRVLDFADGEVSFSGGNLSEPFTNPVVLGANNIVANLGSNPLSLKIKAANGLFDGRATAPNATASFPFKGVVLQRQNYGAGYFLGTNQSGLIFFGPAGP